MNRTLQRPMFRIGGSAGTGITSGLDRPGYKDSLPAAVGSRREELLKALGQQPNNRNLSQFLTTFGLNLLSTPPQGNIFQTAATAAKQPTEQLFAGLDAERNLQRQVSLAAAEAEMAQRDAIALQLLKNDEVAALPYQRKIQYLMDKLDLSEADAIRFVETSKTDYTKATEEDKIQAAMNRMGVANRSLAEYEVRFEPNIPTEFRGGTNKLNQEKNKFPKDPIVGKIYYDKGKGKLYEYNGGDANDIDLGYTDVTEQYR